MPTCVGLRYGRLTTTFSSFSRQREIISFDLFYSQLRSCLIRRVLHYALHSLATSLLHPRGLTILLCHCFTSYDGIGISTDCPSSTPFGLDLGPDLPWADEPSPGNLRLPTAWILTTLSLLMPAFSLVCCPQVLPLLLQPAYIAPLPITLL